jgi:hypothetical protein
VLVLHRPKYACRACEGEVSQAPAPERLIENGIPTEALVAHVIVAKYADHLPLYRQAQIYARAGIALDRSTLADWVGRAAFALRPIYIRLFEGLKNSTKLFADETTAPVLDPGRGRTKTGQLWAYARDDRPWCGPEPPGVVYVYAPDRKYERPAVHLAGFNGSLQVDGYGAYASFAERGDVVLAFCWSHVRRRFEIQAASPAPIAAEALVRIGALYAIETDVRGCSAEERHRVRLSRSKPLVDVLKPWLEAQLEAVSGKSTIAEAIRYAITRWDGLTRFLDDGRIEINSNAVERAIGPIALGRKNHLFAGSDGGAWAILASLIATCKMNGVDPQAYLADVPSAPHVPDSPAPVPSPLCKAPHIPQQVQAQAHHPKRKPACSRSGGQSEESPLQPAVHSCWHRPSSRSGLGVDQPPASRPARDHLRRLSANNQRLKWQILRQAGQQARRKHACVTFCSQISFARSSPPRSTVFRIRAAADVRPAEIPRSLQ